MWHTNLLYVAVNFFLFQWIFVFPLFLNSLARITIHKNNGKLKINWIKKLTLSICSTYWDMLTEKLFYTQLTSSQSEEFRVFVTQAKKMTYPIRITSNVFSLVWEMVHPIKSHSGACHLQWPWTVLWSVHNFLFIYYMQTCNLLI